MSRIGKQPIEVPEGVTVKLENSRVIVSGPKGELGQEVRPEIEVEIKDGQVLIKRKSDTKIARSLHGVTRTLIANMITGVTEEFFKILELHGTGYRVSKEGESLKLLVGFSHPVKVDPPKGIRFEIEGNNVIKVLGVDKQLVGQTAASIRDIRKPDAYKAKGIRYQGEKIKTKPGKAAKIGAGGEV